MRTIEHHVTSKIFQYEDLPLIIQLLFEEAVAARKHAQAPYSKFFVGAAVLGSKQSNIRAGCNVERVSYSQSTHAEQNAIDTLVAEYGPEKINAIAVVAASKEQEIILGERKPHLSILTSHDIPVPCGHCLQIIWENCHNDWSVPLYSLAKSGEIVCVTIGDALPFAFGPGSLGVHYE